MPRNTILKNEINSFTIIILNVSLSFFLFVSLFVCPVAVTFALVVFRLSAYTFWKVLIWGKVYIYFLSSYELSIIFFLVFFLSFSLYNYSKERSWSVKEKANSSSKLFIFSLILIQMTLFALPPVGIHSSVYSQILIYLFSSSL